MNFPRLHRKLLKSSLLLCLSGFVESLVIAPLVLETEFYERKRLYSKSRLSQVIIVLLTTRRLGLFIHETVYE